MHVFFHRSWSFGILLWEIETGGNLQRFSLSVTIVCIYQIWNVSFTTSDFTAYRCKTDGRYLDGKLMGYENFKSVITGYRVVKSLFFEIGMKGIRDIQFRPMGPLKWPGSSYFRFPTGPRFSSI